MKNFDEKLKEYGLTKDDLSLEECDILSKIYTKLNFYDRVDDYNIIMTDYKTVIMPTGGSLKRRKLESELALTLLLLSITKRDMIIKRSLKFDNQGIIPRM